MIVCRKEMRLNDEIIAQLAHNSFAYSGAPPEVKHFGYAQIKTPYTILSFGPDRLIQPVIYRIEQQILGRSLILM